MVAVIPARGGSKGVPGKNLAEWAASPSWRGPCARRGGPGPIEEVVVSTDDPGIAAAAGDAGART